MTKKTEMQSSKVKVDLNHCTRNGLLGAVRILNSCLEISSADPGADHGCGERKQETEQNRGFKSSLS